MSAIDFPNDPTEGDTFTAPSGITWVFNDPVWRLVGSGGGGGGGGAGSDGYTFVQDTVPTATTDGQTWFNTINGNTYAWYVDDDSGQWVQDGPNEGAQGPEGPAGPAGAGTVATVAGTTQQITVAGTPQDRVVSLPTGTLAIPSSAVTVAAAATTLGTGTVAGQSVELRLRRAGTSQNLAVRHGTDGSINVFNSASQPVLTVADDGTIRLFRAGVEVMALDNQWSWLPRQLRSQGSFDATTATPPNAVVATGGLLQRSTAVVATKDDLDALTVELQDVKAQLQSALAAIALLGNP